MVAEEAGRRKGEEGEAGDWGEAGEAGEWGEWGEEGKWGQAAARQHAEPTRPPCPHRFHNLLAEVMSTPSSHLGYSYLRSPFSVLRSLFVLRLRG